MASSSITVADKAALEQTINSYIAQGYVLSNKTESGAIVTKKKEFSVPIAIVTFLFCIIGLVIYAIIYSSQKDAVVNITIGPSTPPPPVPPAAGA